jgi:uncharacterized cupin superfamily protein
VSSVPEAQLKQTDDGLVVESEGWFVLNARDVRWWRHEAKGQGTEYEGTHELPELGFQLYVLMPGQHGVYHGERGQEDFLVVSGECVLVIEGQERRLKPWDLVHCPPWTQHVFVGMGDGPCVVVAAGSRGHGSDVRYPVNEVAARYGASVPAEVSSPDEAHAPFGPGEWSSYREGWLP